MSDFKTKLITIIKIIGYKLASLFINTRLVVMSITSWLYRVTRRAWLRSWYYCEDHWPYVKDRLYNYGLLIRLDRPIGIFLLLWPTLWALWIASDGPPNLKLLFIFVSGVIVMRSAGCVLNDIADRDLDPHVDRTRNRPLAQGMVTLREAIYVAFTLIVIAFILVLQLDFLTVKMSVIGLLLAIVYPFTKRYTYIPQVFLGLAFAWAIPMVFTATTGTVPVTGWLLLMVTVLWAVVYDTMYALVDKKDDIRMGMKSTAILFEDAVRPIIATIQLLIIVGLLMIGSRAELGMIFYAGVACSSLFFIYQQRLLKEKIPELCFEAFLNNNWFGATVFATLVLHYYLLHFN